MQSLVAHQRTLEQPELEINQRLHAMEALGQLGVRRGDGGAPDLLNQALTIALQSDCLEGVGRIWASLGEAAWLKGDLGGAVSGLRTAYDRATAIHLPWEAGVLAFWRWRAGEVFTAPEWIAKPYALQLAGDWQAAAKEWKERGCPYDQGMALMDGDKAAQLAALEIFEGLGAQPIFEKLRRRMRAEGMQGIPRGPRPSTRGHAYGLSGREIEILACLVNGSNNRSIARDLSLSVRTVEHHIASILQKTGTSSRSELVALALKEKIVFAR